MHAAAVGNTQTLTALALDSQALPVADAVHTATVLLNDLLSDATFCAKAGKTSPPQAAALCWNARGHNTGGMVGIKAILDALQLLGRFVGLGAWAVSETLAGARPVSMQTDSCGLQRADSPKRASRLLG